MTTLDYHVGPTAELIKQVPDSSVNLIATSPPFIGLRSYLPDDDPAKEHEIGHEPSPAEFLQALLDLLPEWERVLTDDGSIAVELGDTSADSGGAGGDYNPGGMREGQPKWRANRGRAATDIGRNKVGGVDRPGGHHQGGEGWPMGKSLCLIPTLYAASLAYGFNVLTGVECSQWRIRNLICWARTNPTPGAQGDKFRRGTSYITVATKNRDRYWSRDADIVSYDDYGNITSSVPPLDWSFEAEDTWVIPSTGVPASPIASELSASHYAVWPKALVDRLVMSMVPPRTGTVLDPFCGSGTTLASAMDFGVNGIGFDLDRRNADVAVERCGMFLNVHYPE